MKTSNKQPRPTLAGTSSPSDLLDALQELANSQDDAGSFERFARDWPRFACVGNDAPSNNYVGFDYGEPWTRMPPSIPKRFFLMWQMREVLRKIWSGDTEKVTQVLLPSLDDLLGDPPRDKLWPPQLKVDWQRGEFVYIPRSEFQEAVYQLLRRSSLAKICANPECPARYFIAGRATQRYCSEKCSGVLQRTYKLRWWKEHGSDWRHRRPRRKRGKS